MYSLDTTMRLQDYKNFIIALDYIFLLDQLLFFNGIFMLIFYLEHKISFMSAVKKCQSCVMEFLWI